MTTYSTTDVAGLLDISPARIRRLARTAGLDPSRERGRPYRFGFRDLVLMRTAVALEDSGITPRRLLRSIRALGDQLPPDRPLTAVRITTDTGEVVAVDEDLAWDVESGQTRLKLPDPRETASGERASAPRRPRRREQRESLSPRQWFELGCALQEEQPEQAARAFRQALEGDPDLSDAAVNLGYLLHDQGKLAAAERAYRRALDACGTHPTAAYNLAVALEDLGREEEAREWYQAAIESDPLMADAYYNLSRLCEKIGDRTAALRHLRTYSELIRIG